MTDADLGKEVNSAHRFTYSASELTFTLKHRLSAVGPVEIQAAKAGQFTDGPYQLSQELPITLLPGETRDLTIKVNYGKSIKEATEVGFALVPAGDKDPNRTITVNLSLSAEGRLMFWEEKAQRYSQSLPTFVFDGAGERLVELSWNGAGTGGFAYSTELDNRGAFQLIPNSPGAKPLASGTLVSLGKGGVSYFVKYDGAAKRSGGAEAGRMVFTDPTGRTVAIDLLGTYKGGAIAATNTMEPGKVKMFSLGGKDVIKGEAPTGKENIKHSSGIPGFEGIVPKQVGSNEPKTADASTGTKPISKPQTAPILPAGHKGSITDPLVAKAHLQSFFDRRRNENLIQNDEVRFQVVEGFYQSRFKIVLDSLDKDPSMNISPVWVSAVSGEDSIPIPMTNVEYDADSGLLKVILPSEAESAMAKGDSFGIHVGFMPEYMAGNQPVYLDNQDSVFTGNTIGRLYSESNWIIWLWIGIALFVGLFFFLGWLWVRKPISTFRYLRESRYQRERYVGRDEDAHIEIETVHLDLSRRDTDLIQLSFNIHGESGVTGPRDVGTGKVRSLEATVTAPRRGGLKRFFAWFYSLFGMSREPRFRAVYYSLRIEPVQGGIPQHLRLKDESGILLLGTTLTGNVLSTDHQDIRFTQRPFHYRIYVDPAEILDYSGAMRTVTIPFRVIEEPFEGYVMTRDFRLNLEVHQRV